MLKDNILQILDVNKELIKNVFDIDDNGIENIRELLKEDHENFKQIVDNIFLSDIGIREKMVAYYMIGYVNGARTRKMKN
jgi:hypothetical protein